MKGVINMFEVIIKENDVLEIIEINGLEPGDIVS